MLEKEIERRVTKYAKEKGFLGYKFTSPNHASVPDHLYIHPQGLCFFIEFKRKGCVPTPAQEREIERIRKHLCLVFVVDEVDKGVEVIDWVTTNMVKATPSEK